MKWREHPPTDAQMSKAIDALWRAAKARDALIEALETHVWCELGYLERGDFYHPDSGITLAPTDRDRALVIESLHELRDTLKHALTPKEVRHVFGKLPQRTLRKHALTLDDQGGDCEVTTDRHSGQE